MLPLFLVSINTYIPIFLKEVSCKIKSNIKKEKTRAAGFSQYVKSLLTMLTCHVSAGLSPGCKIPSQLSDNVPWKEVENNPITWVAITCMKDLEGGFSQVSLPFILTISLILLFK